MKSIYFPILLALFPLAVSGQALFVENGATLHVGQGSGTGTVLYVDGNLMNEGTLIDDGSIEVNDSVYLFGTFIFKISSNASGTGFSPLYAGSFAALGGGILQVQLEGGFVPVQNDAFTVVDAVGLDGVFANVDLPSLPSPLYWNTIYNPTAGLVELRVESTVLPVELIDFQAFAEGDKVRLAWVTASEINADRFEVEHSTDGISFVKIGAVAAVGGVSDEQRYRLHHERPALGLNYYRLRQIDLDGSYEFSQMVAVDFGSHEEVGTLTVFPNPTASMLNLVVPDGVDDLELEIFDATGQQVMAARNSLQLDLGHLPVGSYLVRATMAETQKRYSRAFKIVR